MSKENVYTLKISKLDEVQKKTYLSQPNRVRTCSKE